jgi:uncharacterized protein YfaQ (DUF2300 family)
MWLTIDSLEIDLEVTKGHVEIMAQRQSIAWAINANSLDQERHTTVKHIKYCQCGSFRRVLKES